MAIAFVASWTSGQFNNNTGGSLTGRTSTTGNLIAVSAFSSSNTATISDSKTNTYSQWTTAWVNDGAGYFGSGFYKENASGGASHTITLTCGAGNYSVLNASEYSGIVTASAKDKESSGTGTGTSLSSGATATLSQADELAVGFGQIEDGGNTTFTATGSFNLRGQITDGTAGGLGFLMDKIVAATTAVTATATHTTSNLWMCGVMTFLGAAAAAGVSPAGVFVRQAVNRAATY